MNQFRENFWKTVEDEIIAILDELVDEHSRAPLRENKLPTERMRVYSKRIINHVLKGHD